MTRAELAIPDSMKPADGRFGAGPSRLRPGALQRLASDGACVMGTSHRQAPVRRLVGEVREGITALFTAPDGYEVVLGNGGTTAFWDAATCGLVRERSVHLSYGEFSSKFASCTRGAPFIADPVVIEAPAGMRRHHLTMVAPASLALTCSRGRTTRPQPASWFPSCVPQPAMRACSS